MPAIKRYYPPISELLALDNFPEALDFAKDKVSNLLSSIYYKDLQIDKSTLGDSAIYSLKIINKERLEFTIPIIQATVVVNPDSISDFTATPIHIAYSWKILGLLKSYDSSNTLTGVLDFFSIAKEALQLSEEGFLAKAIHNLVIPALDSNNTNIKQLIIDLNAKYSHLTGPNITEPTSGPDFIDELANRIRTKTQVEPSQAIFYTYILDTSEQDTGDPSSAPKSWNRLRKFFNLLLPDDINQFLKDLVIPQAKVSIEIAGALEFPRKYDSKNFLIPCQPDSNGVLQPIDDNGDGTPKAAFTFAKTQIELDTQDGLNFDFDVAVSSSQPVLLGDSGLIADLQNFKVDLSQSKNIPEVDKDGREKTFRGIYVESATIHLPKKWFDFEENPKKPNPTIQGNRLIIGSPGGVSGELTLNSQDLLHFKLLGIDLSLDGFSVKYHQNKVIAGSVGGTALIPKLKDANGNAAELAISIVFNPSGYWLNVSEPDGIQLTLGRFISITLYKLSIGKKDGKFFLELDANVTREFNMPFIDKLLPTGVNINPFAYHDGKVKANVKPEWDSESGVKAKITPEGDIYIKIPIDMKEGSVLDIEALYLNFFGTTFEKEGSSVDGYAAQILFDGSLNLKDKIIADAKGLGVQTNIIPLDGEKGNFGPFDVGLQLVPPERIGLEIDFGKVKGGGFVWIKDDTYIGGLELDFADKFGLVALAIVVTKIPGEEKGYSFLTIITVSFPEAIAIGLGFNLKAVGGLLGLHRRMDVDFLREGVRSGSISHILFPTNIVKNADAIVHTVTSAFPTKKKQYVVGPMFKLNYGLKVSLADIDLGLMIEFPDPIRIAILGIVQVRLPKKKVEAMASEAEDAVAGTELDTQEIEDLEGQVNTNLSPEDQAEQLKGLKADALSDKKAFKGKEAFNKSLTSSKELILINVAFLGLIDFERKMLSFDASIFRSRINELAVEGDIVVRMQWGKEPDFLISIGGFHPDFTPPPLDLPSTIRRISIGLPPKEDVKASVDAYLAITANTVQFGAKLSGVYEDKSLRAVFALWFDVIMSFNPFKFLAQAGAEAAIEYKGIKGISVYLELQLQGPEPWIFEGSATFKALKWDVTLPFYYENGKEQKEKPEQVELQAEIEEAFDFDSNWSVVLPNRNDLSVTLLESNPKGQPLAPAGSFVFSQKAVPLNHQMDKFGTSKPKDYKKVWIDKVETVKDSATTNLPKTNEKGNFASTAFHDYTDEQKLSMPSFTKMNSGVRVSADEGKLEGPYLNHKLVDFEIQTIDRGLSDTQELEVSNDDTIAYHNTRNSAARSDRSMAATATGFGAQPKATKLKRYFSIYTKDDGAEHNASYSFETMQEAEDKRRELEENDPQLENSLYTKRKAA